jgi:hypothetical protein
LEKKDTLATFNTLFQSEEQKAKQRGRRMSKMLVYYGGDLPNHEDHEDIDDYASDSDFHQNKLEQLQEIAELAHSVIQHEEENDQPDDARKSPKKERSRKSSIISLFSPNKSPKLKRELPPPIEDELEQTSVIIEPQSSTSRRASSPYVVQKQPKSNIGITIHRSSSDNVSNINEGFIPEPGEVQPSTSKYANNDHVIMF